jgi:hypothetical protein
MIVHYLHLFRVTNLPNETDSPLVIDSDAVLSLSISLKRFKSIRRRQTKIFQAGGSIYSVELHKRTLLNGRRRLTRKPPMKNSFGFSAAERLDHKSMVNNEFTRRQGVDY